MATTADFKNGLCIDYNGEPFVIVEFQHVKPGKGGAFVRTKLKSLKTGRVIPNTFNAGVKIDIIRVERRQYQFLYADGNDYHFMNNETFEQIFSPKEIIDAPQFLKEGITCDVTFLADNEQPLSCELPTYVELQIRTLSRAKKKYRNQHPQAGNDGKRGNRAGSPLCKRRRNDQGGYPYG